MNKMKNIFQKADMIFITNRKLLLKVMGGVLVLALITQFAGFAGILQLHSEHRSIVATQDNDSGWGIETAENTKFLNDNNRRSYGPVWYRVNYLMRYWTDNSVQEPVRTDQQSKERYIYFTLMLLSLLSIYVFAFALSYVLFNGWTYQFLSTLFLVPLLIDEHWQSQLLVMAKPDHFLSMLVFISFALTIVLFRNRFENKYMRWAGVFWGVTLSTKLTVLPFMPVLLLLFYTPDLKEWKQRCWMFFKYTVISYVLIGFPQNFDFWRNLAYIREQNKATSWADIQSLTEWIKIFYAQFWKAGITLVLFLTLFEVRESLRSFFRKDIAIKSGLLFAIPFLFMLSRKIPEPFFRWYTFPYVYIALLFLAGAFLFVVFQYHKESVNLVSKLKNRLTRNPYYFVVLFFALPLVMPLSSKTLSLTQQEYLNCRAEAHETEQYVDQAVARQEHVLADPYAPYDTKYEGKWVDMVWDMTPKMIVEGQTKWIVLKRGYYAQYLAKAEGGTGTNFAYIEDIEKVRQFYRLFFDKEVTVDQHGQKWTRVHADKCTFEVWKRD